ncbi:MAG: proline dehydrogenase family protein [Flavobacteriales bacterium]|nr:proline dehydrogenase family protein [Flavobacteriales bacterium]
MRPEPPPSSESPQGHPSPSPQGHPQGTLRTALPDLSNTRIAFRQYTDVGLLRAYWLFRFIGVPALNSVGKVLSEAAIKLHLPIKGIIKATIFKHFCGGETIEESLVTAQKLGDGGLGTILDYSVEGQEDDDSLDHTTEEILHTIAMAAQRKDIPFSVFKPSGISPVALLEAVSEGRALNPEETREWALVQQRFTRICTAAAEADIPVLVDAEESWIQLAIDDLAERMMERFNRARAIVYNTVQLYRHDRLAYLKAAEQRAAAKGYHLGLKLVRGAYMEKERARAEEKGYPSPIHADKAAVDRDYDAALHYCADRLGHLAVMVGTHNEQSTLLMAKLMQERGLPANDPRVCFAQLLGMSDNISYNMADAGFRVAKYVPYGPVREVLPYLIRRAQENTSAAGQMGRELKMIVAERARRKREK